MDWMKPEEARNFFGVDDDGLEQLIQDYDLDIDVDEDGFVSAMATENLKEVLFEEHKKQVGHRPDDWREMAKAVKQHEKQEAEERAVRRDKVKQMPSGAKIRRSD